MINLACSLNVSKAKADNEKGNTMELLSRQLGRMMNIVD